MGSSFPSFQSFYQQEIPRDADCPQHHRHDTSDGFTGQEVSSALDPISQSWSPFRPYTKLPISLLKTGSGRWEITGRIVNFTRPGTRLLSTQQQYLILLSDDSGVIFVRVLYPKPCKFDLIFGQRITIFATYITSSHGSEPGYSPYVNFCTTVSPGRDGATHIIFHQDTACTEHDALLRLPPPLHFQHHDNPPDLISLRSFISSGFDICDVQILLCVRSVGPQKKVQRRRREAAVDLVEIGVFDDTATAVLTLWGDHVASAKSFTPNETLLMISQPTCRSFASSNPNCPTSQWLRTKISEISRRDSIVTRIPEGIWDGADIVSGTNTERIVTIAEADHRVRQDPATDFTGRMRLIILEQELTVNPRVLGSLIDESGTLTAAGLAWSNDAWTGLFFGNAQDSQLESDDILSTMFKPSWEDLSVLDILSLREVEDQLLCSRVNVVFGWSSKLGRLCVLGLQW
ncbi:hypothetical protein G7054_g14922 [Neopestalotiopsis clavispora]|nr:hypothetical protein G7054_g14922 [Neopestalotiopsis clavispora]